MSPIRLIKGGDSETPAAVPQEAKPPKGMNVTLKRWLVGLANACLSGLASGGAAPFVGIGWKKCLAIGGFSFFVSFCKWMAQHPLPGAE